MVIGRWSEFNLKWVFHSVSESRELETIVISGEEGLLFVGTRVGLFVFKIRKLELSISSARMDPRLSAEVEYQSGSWALKSPNMIEWYGWSSNSDEILGLYVGAHEEPEGM